MSACDGCKVTIINNSDQDGTIEGKAATKGTQRGFKVGDTIAAGKQLQGKVSSAPGTKGDAIGEITVSFPYTEGGTEKQEIFTLTYRFIRKTSWFKGNCFAKGDYLGRDDNQAYNVFPSSKNGSDGSAYVEWRIDNS